MSPLLMSLVALLSLDQPAPPSPELVDRFIASLPDRQRTAEAIDSEALSRLVALNPGREADIRPILRAHSGCTEPLKRSSGERIFRQVAAILGTARVEAMIRFYEGPDLGRFGTLAEKADRTPEESDELQRLERAYPMEALMTAMQEASFSLFDDGSFFEAMDACDRQRNEAFARANLRSED